MDSVNVSFIDRIVFNIYKILYTYAIFYLLEIAIVVIVPKFIMQKICFDIWDK